MRDSLHENLAKPADVESMEGSTPIWFKRAIMIIGLILVIIGLPVAVNLFCIMPLVLLDNTGLDAIIYGVVSLTIALLTLGAGGAAFLHANRSLHHKTSNSFELPIPILLVAVFIVLIGLGSIILAIGRGTELFFPLILIVCAILPPLWAAAWMIPQASSSQTDDQAKNASAAENVQDKAIQPSLSWRRGLLSFVGGATVSVFIAIMLEILFPVLILLGCSALWIGHAYGHNKTIFSAAEASPHARFLLSDRTIAIWALACLAAIVPAGIAGLKLWLR